MSPRADFTCLSGKCDKAGRLVTYELPIKATRCPVCGSKKIKRLYNRINVLTGRKPDHFDGRHTSSSAAVRLDALVDQPVSAALSKRDELKRSGQRWHGDNGMVRPVPLRNLPAEMARIQGGQAYLGDRPEDRPDAYERQRVAVSGKREERLAAAGTGRLSPVVEPLVGTPVPKEVVVRDTEYKIVKGKDGPEAVKA